ncbi:hypothetical protein HYZ97_02145 [Candidatus Pacearchaeota archaeon]|nr:hypothetical protein [Candidatus Pacearchaeota archaeon]
MKQLRVGVVGYCPPSRYDERKAKTYLRDAFARVTLESPDREIVIVSGLTNVGVLAQAYKLATERGYKTAGVACELATSFELFPTTEEPIIVGKRWGDESIIFTRGVAEVAKVDSSKEGQYRGHPHYGLDALIKIGGGNQSAKEAELLREAGKIVFEYDLPRLE